MTDTVGDRPRRLVLTEFRAIHKNTLVGFGVFELPSGLVIRDVSIHQKNGRRWASLPARPQLDSAGRQIKNHAGKALFSACLGWRDRTLADRFSAAAVSLVLEQHPEVFEDEER